MYNNVHHKILNDSVEKNPPKPSSKAKKSISMQLEMAVLANLLIEDGLVVRKIKDNAEIAKFH